MIATEFTAKPQADGRVVLEWKNPVDPDFGGVRLLRTTGRSPGAGDAGSPAEILHATPRPGERSALVDGPLQGETIYYYTLVTYDTGGRQFPLHTSALALEPYQTAALLYRSLPELYALFDRTRQPDGPGPLERFVQILGHPFDVMRSIAGSMRDLHDVARVDGHLLPRLAQWIGLPPDRTPPLDRQRNEIRFGPHYFRTAGVPANLRAQINHFTNWDGRIKELVHNIFLSTHPEQLRIHEQRAVGAAWEDRGPVNDEVAYEGRPAVLSGADGTAWLFYHARRGSGENESAQLYVKAERRGEFAPALRLTSGPDLYKHPAAAERPNGSIWLFSGRYRPADDWRSRLSLMVLSAGRDAEPATVEGTQAPAGLADGDTFKVTVSGVERNLVLRPERFSTFPGVPAPELARWLDDELPGAAVTATAAGRIRIETLATDPGASIRVGDSTLAPKLGLTGAVADATAGAAARVDSERVEPFPLVEGSTLTVKLDTDEPRTVTFHQADIPNLAAASAADVARVLGRELGPVAEAVGGRVRLQSSRVDAASLVAVLVEDSSAADPLGFGVAPPSAADTEEDEPSATVQGDNVWLSWAAKPPGGVWGIRYSRCVGRTWGTPKALTDGPRPAREPFILFDPGPGRLWAFYAVKKATGLWNVFSRTTTNLDFATQTAADWAERENGPVPADFDNREPAAAVGAAEVQLYYSSDRSDGWGVWRRDVTAANEGPEAAVATGDPTHRAPCPLRTAGGTLRLFLRSNSAETYVSELYPASLTFDARYSGSTTVDFRNPGKLGRRGLLTDISRYSYDTRRHSPGPSERRHATPGLYSRETVAAYLTPDTDDQQLVILQRQMAEKALSRFLPIQVRLVLLVQQFNQDLVYTYDRPDAPEPRRIGEAMMDTILPEVYRGAADSHRDRAPGVRFLRTWTAGEGSGLPDLAVNPPGLGSRLYTRHVDEGG